MSENLKGKILLLGRKTFLRGLARNAKLSPAITFVFHFQQIEHTSRLDFIWKEKFKVERDEVETMGSLNKILLENILPAHVADHFLKSGKRFSEVTDQVLSFIILF